jgi:hypothetical protein
VDELYIIARRVLLDALDALGTHRDAVTLVGAQAIYLRVGEADLAVAPYTTDGDLAIDPSRLAEIPPLERALTDAGFRLKSPNDVGMWVTHRPTSSATDTEVQVDLLVPISASPARDGRAARLPGHEAKAARNASGLDGVLVDVDVMPIHSLEAEDSRTFDLRVAGPAALLVAKLHKIEDRLGGKRSNDKDALDVLRLLRGVETEELAQRFERLRNEPASQPEADAGLHMLRERFAEARGEGAQLAARAAAPLEEPEEITASCAVLAEELLGRLHGR